MCSSHYRVVILVIALGVVHTCISISCITQGNLTEMSQDHHCYLKLCTLKRLTLTVRSEHGSIWVRLSHILFYFICISYLYSCSRLFGIDMSSGELTFHGDEVQQKEYRLSVLASDSGDPPLHGIALVTVTFDVGPAAVTGGGGGGGVSVVVPIILGILAGVLLIIIIIMVLYIYRQ